MESIRLKKGVRIAEGAKGGGIAYTPDNAGTWNLTSSENKLIYTVRKNSVLTVDDLAGQLGLRKEEVEQIVNDLTNKGILEEDLTDKTSRSVNAVRNRFDTWMQSRKVDRYKYRLCKAYNLPIIGLWLRSEKWQVWGRRIFPFMLVIACLEIYGFYFSGTRALGKVIEDEIFYSPSIYEAFIVFTATNFLTIVYKIAVGWNQSYAGSELYLKLLAGFNPVFDTDDDKDFKRIRVGKYEYLYYLASPTIVRLYMLMIGIAAISIFYPFVGSASRALLSVTMTIINISLMALGWQILPSPGTLSVKLLEVAGVLPHKFLGFSAGSVKRWHTARKNSSGNKRQSFPIKSATFLGITLLLVIFKIGFLGFWVLPQISVGIPQFLGQWTSQIMVGVLGLLALQYIWHGFIPKKTVVAYDDTKENERNGYSDVKFDHGKNIIGVVKKSQYEWLLVVALVLLFPFGSTVSGSARVQEAVSLEIKSVEKESAVIKHVFYAGPSSKVIAQGTPLVKLESKDLELAIFDSKERLISLQAEKKILEVNKRALGKGGSRFESSKNRTEDVQISDADVRSARNELESLRRQKTVLEAQVETYRVLSEKGAVSILQYQDKVLELEEKGIRYENAASDLEIAVSTLSKAQRDKDVEQSVKLGEEKVSVDEELAKVDAEIKRERSNLVDLDKRRSALVIKAPFDCVIDSDTSLLRDKTVVSGDDILSVKAVPTERVIVSIPEYDRNEVRAGDRVEVRLYSRVASRNSGHLYGVVERLSPVSSTEFDQEKLEVTVELKQSLGDSMIGASGTGKIRVGYTCLLANILRPLVRFVEVDVWQYLP